MIPPTRDTPTGKSGVRQAAEELPLDAQHLSELEARLEVMQRECEARSIVGTGRYFMELAEWIPLLIRQSRLAVAAEQRGTEGSLHQRIMNLPCKHDADIEKAVDEGRGSILHRGTREEILFAYKIGWRDTRHAAAELSLSAITQRGTGLPPDVIRGAMLECGRYVSLDHAEQYANAFSAIVRKHCLASPSPAGDEAMRDFVRTVDALLDHACLVEPIPPELLPSTGDELMCTGCGAWYKQGHHGNCPIGDVINARAALAASPAARQCEVCAKLRAIVDRLPKTRDGVPIVPGMKVFLDDQQQDAIVEGVCADFISCKQDDGAHRQPYLLVVFSTREAAIAASPAPESAAPSTEATP